MRERCTPATFATTPAMLSSGDTAASAVEIAWRRRRAGSVSTGLPTVADARLVADCHPGWMFTIWLIVFAAAVMEPGVWQIAVATIWPESGMTSTEGRAH